MNPCPRLQKNFIDFYSPRSSRTCAATILANFLSACLTLYSSCRISVLRYLASIVSIESNMDSILGSGKIVLQIIAYHTSLFLLKSRLALARTWDGTCFVIGIKVYD